MDNFIHLQEDETSLLLGNSKNQNRLISDLKQLIIKANLLPQPLAEIVARYAIDPRRAEMLYLERWFQQMETSRVLLQRINCGIITFSLLNCVINFIILFDPEIGNFKPLDPLAATAYLTTLLTFMCILALPYPASPMKLRYNPEEYQQHLKSNTSLAKENLRHIPYSLTFQIIYSISLISSTMSLVAGICVSVYLPDSKIIAVSALASSSIGMALNVFGLYKSGVYKEKHKKDDLILSSEFPNYSALSSYSS